jgi:hypothetical protein
MRYKKSFIVWVLGFAEAAHKSVGDIPPNYASRLDVIVAWPAGIEASAADEADPYSAAGRGGAVKYHQFCDECCRCGA